MSIGITKTLEVIGIVEDLSVRLIHLAKTKSVFDFLTQAPAIFTDVSIVAADSTLVVPELASLDPDEVGQLGKAGCKLVLSVVGALKS